MAKQPAPRRRKLTGRCRCGAVRYAVADEFRYALNCHCSDCRRTTGSAFKPFGGIERAKLRLTRGARSILVYGDPRANHDVHCRVCGTLLYSVLNEGRMAHVTYGTLGSAPTLRPTAHILVRDKAPWFEITDALPQFARFPT